jgi:hypothetical protein
MPRLIEPPQPAAGDILQPHAPLAAGLPPAEMLKQTGHRHAAQAQADHHLGQHIIDLRRLVEQDRGDHRRTSGRSHR